MSEHVSEMVFVGGLHRSGTSLVAEALASAPGAAGLTGTGAWEDEGQHLQDVYPTAREFGGPGRFAFAEAAHMTETDAPDAARQRAEIEHAWFPWWSRPAAVHVEKSPPNLIRARYLQALFPEARFVMVVRHPLAVAMATRKRMARRVPLAQQVEHWFEAHRIMRVDAPYVGRLIVLSYESLVAGEPAAWAALSSFTGLDLVQPRGLDADVNRRYLTAWRAGIDDPDLAAAGPVLGRHREELAGYGYVPWDVELHRSLPVLPDGFDEPAGS